MSNTLEAKLLAKMFRMNVLAKLPEKLRCPKCSTDQHKDNFGVRILAWRDRKPVRATRQSYCAECRRNHAKGV